jgi:hypothetical protein
VPLKPRAGNITDQSSKHFLSPLPVGYTNVKGCKILFAYYTTARTYTQTISVKIDAPEQLESLRK